MPPDLWDDPSAPPAAEPEGSPEDAWEDLPVETAPAKGSGGLLEDPRFKLVQEIFPGRLLSYQPSLGFSESSLTEREAQGRVNLDTATSEADAEEV